MGRILFSGGKVNMEEPVPGPTTEVGTIWRFTSNGTFEVPDDGLYQIEMHGGGGGGGGVIDVVSAYYQYEAPGQGGGGSGSLQTVSLNKGDVHQVTIGQGGAHGADDGYDADNDVGAYTSGHGANGGTTSFGPYSVAGGYGGYGGHRTGYNPSPKYSYSGQGVGNIASAGSNSEGTGGYGNVNNTAQTYGNGGRRSDYYSGGRNGKPGAVIITYLGVS